MTLDTTSFKASYDLRKLPESEMNQLIADLPENLVSVSLKNCCNFTDLSPLQNMPYLQRVNLIGCRQLTEKMLDHIPESATIIITSNCTNLKNTKRHLIINADYAGDWSSQLKKFKKQ